MVNQKPPITVSIVTPDGTIYENDQAKLIIVKTQLGELGIMANHVPVIASLVVNEARIKSINENKEIIIAVNGGFIEFSNNVATIVANTAELQENIDVDRAKIAQNRAQIQIDKAIAIHDKDEMLRAEISLHRAINRINVANE